MTLSNSELNPLYSFESFVIGSCNLFAHSAAKGVAENPAEMYNPLFLHSGVGLGKTHLMQAIGREMRSERRRRLKIMYLSTESFTSQLIMSIRNRSTSEFREKYRTVDVLLVDDIHFIAGKDATQEEFFHTFNALHDRKKQIVISSDRPPKEIPTLEDRLVSRFEWGLVASLEPPDFDTRVAILKQKAKGCKAPVPTEVIELIAKHIRSNIRQLEGALTRLIATASVHRESISLQMATDMLHETIANAGAGEVTVDKIMAVSAQFFGLKQSDLASSRRSRAITFPRQVAMYLCRQLTTSSLYEIGRAFGKKDHTTVMHACRKIDALINSDPKQASSIQSLREEIEA